MQPIRVITRPQALFPDTEAYVQRCQSVMNNVLTIHSKLGLTDEAMQELRCFPEAYKALVLVPQLQEELLDDLALMPPIVLDILLTDYETNSPFLEAILYNCPELLYKLMVWARENSVRLRYPWTFYTQLLLEDVIWAIRWNQLVPNEKFRHVVLDYIEENRFSEGGAASLYLQLNPDEDAEPYSAAISSHWKYALLASLLFQKRGIDLEVLQQEAIHQPQWAYHFLKYVPQMNTALAEQTLMTNPLWLAEYLKDAKADKKAALGQQALSLNNPHPLWPDFRQWLERGK